LPETFLIKERLPFKLFPIHVVIVFLFSIVFVISLPFNQVMLLLFFNQVMLLLFLPTQATIGKGFVEASGIDSG